MHSFICFTVPTITIYMFGTISVFNQAVEHSFEVWGLSLFSWMSWQPKPSFQHQTSLSVGSRTDAKTDQWEWVMNSHFSSLPPDYSPRIKDWGSVFPFFLNYKEEKGNKKTKKQTAVWWILFLGCFSSAMQKIWKNPLSPASINNSSCPLKWNRCAPYDVEAFEDGIFVTADTKVTTYGGHGRVLKMYLAKASQWIQWSQEKNLIHLGSKKIIMNLKAFNSNTSIAVVL